MNEKIVRINGRHPGAFSPLLKGMRPPVEDTVVEILGCTSLNYAAGVLSAAFYPDRTEILWLYVAPTFRRCGIGGKLLTALLELVGADGRVEVSLTKNGKEMSVEESLLDRFGFTREETLTVFSFTLKDIIDGPMRPLKLKISSNIVYRDQLRRQEWKQYQRQAVEREKNPFVMLRDSDISPQSVLYIRDGRLMGCLVLNRDLEGSLEVELLYSEGPRIVGELFGAAVQRMAREYPPDTRIYTATMDKSMEKNIAVFTMDRARMETCGVRYVLEPRGTEDVNPEP